MQVLENISREEKWHVLQLILGFNCVLGVGMFGSTLFLDSNWGGGASFQAVLTAMIHLVYSGYVLKMVREMEISNVDFFGGIMVMMNVLLLQTAALWGDFSGGKIGGNPLCTVGSGASERVISALSSILFVSHIGFSGLIVFWKNDLFSSSGYLRNPVTTTKLNNNNNNNSQSYQQNKSSSGIVLEEQNRFVIDDGGDAEL